MSEEYYEGMFMNLRHNILCMLSQIEGNIEYCESVDISDELEFIKNRCDEIIKQFKDKKEKNG